MSDISLYFDGACEPTNPRGIASFGYVIIKEEKKIKEGFGIIEPVLSETSTNNVAEYSAILNGIKYIVENNYLEENIKVFGDSQLVINQMNEEWSVKNLNLIFFYNQIKELTNKLSHISYSWIPREMNKEADFLSHKAYELFLDNNIEIRNKLKGYFASQKQKDFLDRLKIPYDKYIGKREASRLISLKLDK